MTPNCPARGVASNYHTRHLAHLKFFRRSDPNYILLCNFAPFWCWCQLSQLFEGHVAESARANNLLPSTVNALFPPPPRGASA
jgi:hypothetical protein